MVKRHRHSQSSIIQACWSCLYLGLMGDGASRIRAAWTGEKLGGVQYISYLPQLPVEPIAEPLIARDFNFHFHTNLPHFQG